MGRSISSLMNKLGSLGNLTAGHDQAIIAYSEGFASQYIDPRIAIERAWTRFWTKQFDKAIINATGIFSLNSSFDTDVPFRDADFIVKIYGKSAMWILGVDYSRQVWMLLSTSWVLVCAIHSNQCNSWRSLSSCHRSKTWARFSSTWF